MEHPVAAGIANFGTTAVATGGLGATAAGARLLGMAPAGTGLIGQGVRAALGAALAQLTQRCAAKTPPRRR